MPFQGLKCHGNDQYNDLATLVFNPQVISARGLCMGSREVRVGSLEVGVGCSTRRCITGGPCRVAGRGCRLTERLVAECRSVTRPLSSPLAPFMPPFARVCFTRQGYLTSALFQGHSGTFSFSSMLLYGIMYWLMAGITYGAFIPSGLFTPSLIFGGLLG